jgi:nucleoside-diphosphate-sugar epimerase
MGLKSARTLVTGGTSFIRSHLVEQLVSRVGSLRVIDNLSSGRREYLDPLIADGVEFMVGDLLDQATTRRALDGIDLVFHLAADHGGRGYVDLHQVSLMGWEPKVPFEKGLHQTIDWYFTTKDRAKVSRTLEASLTER